MTPIERRKLLDEMLGAGDAALALGTGAAAEVLSGYAGILGSVLPGPQGQGADWVARTQEAATWNPRTSEAARNLGVLAEGVQAAAGYKPLLMDKTIGEELQGYGDYWRDRSVPALQRKFGVEGGSTLGALGIGAAGAVPLPGRSAGRAARLSDRLLSDAIDPKKYRDEMISSGYLLPDDPLPRGREAAIAAQIANSPGMNANQLADAALAGWPKRGWYRDSAQALVDVFGDDSKRFTYLLSALSPQTSVESNLKNAVNTWTNWVKAGRPKDKDSILRIMGESVEGDKGTESVLEAWQNNSFRALSEPNMEDIRFSGPKVSAFARNLMGQLGYVTNDAWMAKAMDVDQDIFSGTGSAKDAFGALSEPGAGYQAASAVTREAADILNKRFAEQGIEITPAEVQEMVWSYAKPLWEARDAEGNLRPMQQLVDEGVLTDDMIAGTPDFGTLLSETPEYRSSLESVGGNFSAIRPHSQDIARPAAPDPKNLAAFNTRFENRYRRDAIPSEMNRTISSILSGTPQFTDPGRLRTPGWTQGVKGRPIEPTEYRGARLNSLGFDNPGFLQLEPGEAGGALFQQFMRNATDAHKFGDSVDVHDVEKYANSDLYLADKGAGGFALDNGNLISAFSHPDLNKMPNFADSLLMAGVNQGARYLDAFDTRLPSFYSRGGFKPSSRLPFSDEVQQAEMPDWDFEKYGKFNEGRPDVMSMVLDPKNAKIISPSLKPYAKQSAKAQKARQGILADDYDEFLRMQQEELERIRNSGNYSAY